MELFLVQHGEAKSRDEDSARPLTDSGREDVRCVARAARRMSLQVRSIYHSGKLRALQTAEILSAELHPDSGPDELTGLTPNDDPHVVSGQLERLGSGTMLVGHLPHLSRLASLLVVGDPDRELIAFRNGGIVCLTGGPGS